jgi:hypothetical protein
MELARIEPSGLQTLLFNGSPLAISRRQGHSFKTIISNDSDGSVPHFSLLLQSVWQPCLPSPGLLFDAKDALGFLCKISGQSIAEDFCWLIRIPVNRCYENAFRQKDLFLMAANHLAPDFHCS